MVLRDQRAIFVLVTPYILWSAGGCDAAHKERLEARPTHEVGAEKQERSAVLSPLLRRATSAAIGEWLLKVDYFGDLAKVRLGIADLAEYDQPR